MRRDAVLLLAVLAAVSGCAGTDGGSAASGASVTVVNCGVEYQFPRRPERVVTTSLPATELMLALGLRDKLVGTVPAKDLHRRFAGQLDGVHLVADKAFPPPAREAVLAVAPDLVVSGYSTDFEQKALGDRAELKSRGVNTYLVQGACANAEARVADTLADIDNLGRIFGVPDRAAELAKEITGDVGDAPPGEPVGVFVYEGQEGKPLTSGRGALINDLLRLAGGRNIFSDAPSFGEVSWEEVVARDPKAIVIVSQAGFVEPDKAKADLLGHPALRGVTAIRDQRFVVLGVNSSQPGIRIPEAVRTLRDGLGR